MLKIKSGGIKIPDVTIKLDSLPKAQRNGGGGVGIEGSCWKLHTIC